MPHKLCKAGRAAAQQYSDHVRKTTARFATPLPCEVFYSGFPQSLYCPASWTDNGKRQSNFHKNSFPSASLRHQNQPTLHIQCKRLPAVTPQLCPLKKKTSTVQPPKSKKKNTQCKAAAPPPARDCAALALTEPCSDVFITHCLKRTVEGS